jgi:hypothetical protein
MLQGVDELRFRPIIEIVSPHLSDLTQKADNRYDALCPFHDDKNPSLSVYLDTEDKKGRYKCWSCGASGDAIDFLMELLEISYADAKKIATEEVDTITELEDRLRDVTKYASSPINLPVIAGVMSSYAQVLPKQQYIEYAIRLWTYAFAGNHRLVYAVLDEMEVECEFSRM